MVGYTWRENRKKYMVQFRKKMTQEYVYLGYFNTEYDAAMCYDNYIYKHGMHKQGYKVNNKKQSPKIRKRHPNEIPPSLFEDEQSDEIPPPIELD